MCCVASVSLSVREDTPLYPGSFIASRSGELIALLRVGEGATSVHGSPDALRRLAEELVVAAEAAEELRRGQLNGTAA